MRENQPLQVSPYLPSCQEHIEDVPEVSVYVQFKIIEGQDWIDLYNFRFNSSPEDQEKYSPQDIERFTSLLLFGQELPCEFEYPFMREFDKKAELESLRGLKTWVIRLRNAYQHFDSSFRLITNSHKQKKLRLWDRESFEAVKRENKERLKTEKKLPKSTRCDRKKKLIQSFLVKDAQDRKRLGLDAKIFPREVVFEKIVGAKISKVLHLKRTLAEEYDYFLARDKREIRIQNEGLIA